MVIRIESMNKDNSHSWVRISHGLIKLVTDLSNKEYDDNEHETSEMQFKDCALKSNVLAFASRSKAKAKPQRRFFASSSTKIAPIGERTWTDIEPQDYSSIDFPVLKQLITLLRHGSLRREDDGAIEFWRLKDHIRKNILCNINIGLMKSGRASWQKEETRKISFEHSQFWSDEKWKSTMAKSGGNTKNIHYCTDPSGEILYLRALQDHSGRNPIDPSLQDNVLIPDNFFEYIHHIGCAFNLHSIKKFRIDTGRTKIEQKTDGILYVCGIYEQKTQRS